MTFDLTADLYKACLQISPGHPDYATRSIEDGFDWSSLSCCLFERLYLVVFRSVRWPGAELDLLREHEDRAYEEALVSGGLLRYFKGHANERGECLSFCLWETREQARQAADAASHRSAAGVSAQSTSHTRSNVTGYRRSQRSSSSSASRIEGTDRGGKRHAPPV